MDRFNGNIDNSLTKEEQENEANAAIEAEMRDATEAANQLDDEMQNTEGGDNPLVLVGKRPGEPNSTEDQQPQKKPKLEENQTQDVASAAPPEESNNKKKKQVSFKTPPGSLKSSTAPVTPSGKHLNQSPDQGNSPVGPTVDKFFAGDTNSDDDSGSETETDIDGEFAKMCAKEAEGAIDGETSSEGSVAEENPK